jgi:hypothetical protein
MGSSTRSPSATTGRGAAHAPFTCNGPRELIKKGRRFRARATVTKLNGKTALLIHDVVEVI